MSRNFQIDQNSSIASETESISPKFPTPKRKVNISASTSFPYATLTSPKKRLANLSPPPSPPISSESSASPSPSPVSSDTDEAQYANTPKRYRAGGIVLDPEDNLLIVFGKHSRKWSLPKGALNDGEDCLKGALREIWEETGFKMKPKNDEESIMSWTINKAKIYLLRLNEVMPKPNPIDLNEVEKAMWLKLGDQKQMASVKERANKMLIVALERLERVYGRK